jgi:hypothetical protein
LNRRRIVDINALRRRSPTACPPSPCRQPPARHAGARWSPVGTEDSRSPAGAVGTAAHFGPSLDVSETIVFLGNRLSRPPARRDAGPDNENRPSSFRMAVGRSHVGPIPTVTLLDLKAAPGIGSPAWLTETGLG